MFFINPGEREAKVLWIVKVFPKALHLACAAVACLLLCSCEKETSKRSKQKVSIPSEVAIELPADEEAFLQLLAAFKKKAEEANNQLQVNRLREERRTELRKMLGSECLVKGWVGMLGPLGETDDGDVFLSMHLRGFGKPELEYIARLITMTHPLADKGFNTLIKKDTPLYHKLHTIKRDAMVRFSGHFIKGENDHIRVLNDFSAMKSPYALFKFTNIDPL